jgi:hypothetical protein
VCISACLTSLTPCTFNIWEKYRIFSNLICTQVLAISYKDVSGSASPIVLNSHTVYSVTQCYIPGDLHLLKSCYNQMSIINVIQTIPQGSYSCMNRRLHCNIANHPTIIWLVLLIPVWMWLYILVKNNAYKGCSTSFLHLRGTGFKSRPEQWLLMKCIAHLFDIREVLGLNLSLNSGYHNLGF